MNFSLVLVTGFARFLKKNVNGEVIKLTVSMLALMNSFIRVPW